MLSFSVDKQIFWFVHVKWVLLNISLAEAFKQIEWTGNCYFYPFCLLVAITRILEPKDSGEYSDDFSSSDEEDVQTVRRAVSIPKGNEDSGSDIESDIPNNSRRSSDEGKDYEQFVAV